MDIAIGLFYESGGTAGGSTSESRNIHEISAEMSTRNDELTSAPPAAIILSDSDDEEFAQSRPTRLTVTTTANTVEFNSNSEEDEDDVVFNSNYHYL